MRACAIDFEYTDGHMAHPHLVCACLDADRGIERYWLDDGSDTCALVNRINELKKDTVFIAHAVEKAEGMCFIQLGIRDPDLKWWDTMLVEHLNTNVAKSDRIGLSLVETLSRHGLLEEDTDEVKRHKERMRKVIIDKDDIAGHRKAILDYCSSDIHLLKSLMVDQFKALDAIVSDTGRHLMFSCLEGKSLPTTAEVAIRYSSNAWLFALIDANGIPLKTDEVQRFLDGSEIGSYNLKLDFNRRVGVIYEFKTTKRCGKTKRKATAKRDLLQSFIGGIISDNGIDDWPKSEKTGMWSLKDEVLKEHERIDWRLAELRQHKKFDKMLSSFTREGDKNWLSSYSPSEGRVFSYHGFGMTQTFRNAASPRTGFVPLWSKAMRTLMYPPEGKVLIAVDYSSEEFILGMDLYQDDAGRDSYRQGDIYIATGIKMGMLPNGAKKGDVLPSGERVKDVRQRVKGLVLGLGYGMGYKSLAKKVGVDEDTSKQMIASYKGLYSSTFETQDLIKRTLKQEPRYFMLPNGYSILARSATGKLRADGTENNATLSSINWLVQASGAYILQSIVNRCLKEGLKIITTVHDEVVIEADEDKAEACASMLSRTMVDAYEELTGTRNVRTGAPEICGGASSTRFDHNEDGNKAYNTLLEMVSVARRSDNEVFENKSGGLYIDDIEDEFESK